MPWDQRSTMDQKRLFIADYLTRSFTIVDLCDRFGISRPTAYKWIQRFLNRGYEGLDELPRRPSRCPHRTADDLVEILLELRRKHPSWGPKKLLKVLTKRRPEEVWPARSTIAAVGNSYFLVLTAQDRLRIARQNYAAANRVLTLIKQRFDAGTASQLDVAQQLADSGIKVVLTGEGADEMFAGYDLFREGKVRRFWGRRPASTLRPRLLERLYPYLARSPVAQRAFAREFFGRGLGRFFLRQVLDLAWRAGPRRVWCPRPSPPRRPNLSRSSWVGSFQRFSISSKIR